ncbi:MFS transporter [Kocuria sp. LUK]|uniref:MFS transporter n=1 Tax=Kocuria TaxID=57493 RepID=UPI001E4CCAB4|nr:MFS transporter [Kocuria sp. LUK]MCD1145990.1 MFS transporter [Kocuria sp. LUK]
MAEAVPPGAWPGYDRGSPGYRRVLLALLCAGVATFAQLYSVQGVLPLLAAELGVDAAQASLGVSAATLGLAAAVLPWSVVSDRWGRLRTMVVAVAAATALGLVMPLAPGFEALVVLRFAEGAALGGIPAVAMAYLAEEVAGRHTAVAAGTYVAGTTLGGLAGRIVAAPVGDALGWRAGTLTVSVLAAAAAVAFVLLAPRQRGFVRRSVRLTGADGLAGRLRANLADPGLVVLCVLAFLLMGGFVAIYNYLGFHLGEEPFGVSQTLVSLLFLAYLSGTWSSGAAGRVAAARGRRTVLLGSGALMLAGLAGTLAPWLPVVVAGLLVFTAGFFAAHAVASGWVAVRASTGRAQASSLYTLFYYAGSSVLGWAVGLAYTGAGWAAAVGAVAGLVVVAGVLVALVLRDPAPGR